MHTLSRRAALALPAALALATTAARAQAPTPTRLRGTIAALEGDVLSVATREGPRAMVTLADPLTVAALRRVTIADIAVGGSVGVVAVPGEASELRAVAITVLPPGARINERQVAWDLAPNTSMNDGPVEAVVEGSGGGMLTLKIHGHSVRIAVTPETTLVMPIAAARADLVVGAAVFINAMQAPDGKLSASRVVVAKNGVAPPI